MKRRSWTKEDLVKAVSNSKSIRQVLFNLGLVEAGGNYEQIKKYIKQYKINTKHFTGKAWNKGMKGRYLPLTLTKDILKINRDYSLKVRNYLNVKSAAGQKNQKMVESQLNLII